MLEPLPIDSHLPAIVERLTKSRNLVLAAPPGTGKTTRVPRALLDAGFCAGGEILVLEPRRLAARLAAARVAEEIGEEVGATVGYTIRFESCVGPSTRIRFLTEGVLSRRIVSDPGLLGVTTVVLDEFHERHLATDLALSFIRQLQETTRHELRIVVMSATMEPEPISRFLGDCPVLEIKTPRFPVELVFRERPTDRPLEAQVLAAVTQLIRTGVDGDVLVFLPGAADIRRSSRVLQESAAKYGFLVVPLHGDLTAREQALAIRPAPQSKVILATNVAESSVTIPGVAAVVDSGLARAAGHSFWAGLPTLSTVKISRASAEQRAGRAGRTRAGRVVRLYTAGDFDGRPERDLPEIRRADLSDPLLTLHGAGVRDPRTFRWFERPPDTALEAAESLLRRLGALDSKGEVTPRGRRMLAFPLHPRLARTVVEGEARGVADDAVLMAALLSERDIRMESKASFGERPRQRTRAAAESDVAELVELYRELENHPDPTASLQSGSIDTRTLESVRRAYHVFRRLVPHRERTPLLHGDARSESLRIALLAGFPDRVAMRRGAGARDLLLCEGGSAELSAASAVHHAPLLVAVDAERQSASKTGSLPRTLVRLASAIKTEWLAEMFPEDVCEERGHVWNERAGRVDEVRRSLYGHLRLEETSRPAPPDDQVTCILAAKAIERGLRDFPDREEFTTLGARIELAARQFSTEGFEAPGDRVTRAVVNDCCRGKRSFAELARTSLRRSLEALLTARQLALLERELPERIAIPGGRRLKVHYEPGTAPWVESRLQDFIGLVATPALCSGRLPLTVRLLAPNNRPVQVTQDLGGFWRRHYPAVRRELQRRYPKHVWPDPDEVLAPLRKR